MAVAILNIYIPKIMSDLINVIAKFNERVESESFMDEIKTPALKLVGLYIAQVYAFIIYYY